MQRFRSLPVRTRLTGWYVLVLAAVLVLYIGVTSVVLYFQLWNQLSRFAIQDVETIEGLLYFDTHGKLHLNEDYHNHPQSRQILERLLEVVSPAGDLLYRNDRLGQDILGGKPTDGEGVDGYSERSGRLRNGTRILVVSRRHVLEGKPVVIRLAYSEESLWSRLEELVLASLVAFPFILGVAGIAGYQLARRLLKPLEQMAVQAEAITAEKLGQRLPVENPGDELGHLARVFNGVLDRLEQSFDRLRRFTSDASHELRTPLASIRTVGEVGLQKSRTSDDYQDTIGSMLEEVDRLTKLVDNLLTISRADASQVQLTLSTFSLFDLAKEAESIVEVLAEERSQKVLLSQEGDPIVSADRLLLRQALINVIHNAVKYSPEGGTIAIHVKNSEANRATVRIADNGPGIPSEHRTKIFDRFYRVDSARARDTGGAGLGLSIASWAIESQGGKILVEDSESGAAFVIEMPSAGH